MTGHIVVVGLDDVAFHVTEILSHLNLPCVVVDSNPGLTDTTAVQYVSLLGDVPVIRGELSQALNTARVDHAMGLITLDKSNETNLVACLRANRSGARANVRTVARIFDGEDLDRHFEDWGVDRRLAAVDKAADAFVEGAIRELLVRSFKLPDPTGCQWMHCVRCPAGVVSRDEWRRLYARGVRAIAEVDGDGAMTPTAHSLDCIGDHNDAILVGPRTVMMKLVSVIEGGSPPSSASRNCRRTAGVRRRRGRPPQPIVGAHGAHPADNGRCSQVGS